MVLNGNSTLMSPNYLLAKIKSETKTTTLPTSGLISSVKWFGNFGYVLFAKTRTKISDLNFVDIIDVFDY